MPYPDATDPLGALDNNEARRIANALAAEGAHPQDALTIVNQILEERRELDRQFGAKVRCCKCRREMPRRDALPVGLNGSAGLLCCPHCHYTCENVEEVHIRLSPDSPEALKRVQQIAHRWLDEARRMHDALYVIIRDRGLPLAVRAAALCAANPVFAGSDPAAVTEEVLEKLLQPTQQHLNQATERGRTRRSRSE